MTTTAQLTEAGTSRFVQAGDLRMHYNEAGTGDTVIFLHGGGPGATGWSNFIRNIGPLAEHYHVMLVDMPQYGKSDDVVMTETHSEVTARAVKDMLDALGIEKASLVGNSMGGGATLAFAVDYADRLEKMVLMGSAGGGTNIFDHQPSEGIKILMHVANNPSVEGLRSLFQVMVYDSSFVNEELLQQRYQGIVDNPGHQEARSKSSRVFRDIFPQLAKVKTPALIIHGRNDRVVALEGSLRLLSVLENSRLTVFNKCGHWAQFEHADEFNRLVMDFLSHDN
jgi:2,6-dioxo-6-phenylhexa-3-enoate hydrolase